MLPGESGRKRVRLAYNRPCRLTDNHVDPERVSIVRWANSQTRERSMNIKLVLVRNWPSWPIRTRHLKMQFLNAFHFKGLRLRNVGTSLCRVSACPKYTYSGQAQTSDLVPFSLTNLTASLGTNATQSIVAPMCTSPRSRASSTCFCLSASRSTRSGEEEPTHRGHETPSL